MKATHLQQQALLDLASLDLRIGRLNRQMSQLETSETTSNLVSSLVAASTELIDLNGKLETIALDEERLEQDLQLVEERIARDLTRVENSSNPKDISGMQHELDSLSKRKSALEELGLELIEQRESLASQVQLADRQRSEIDRRLMAARAETARATNGIASELEDASRERASLMAQLSEEQISLYEKLVGKTVPVARLEGLSCGACNMNLSGSSIDEIRATAPGELARCPECAAMLVRIQ